MTSLLFRRDSISLHLPLSLSEWVSQWLGHSFRFGDSCLIYPAFFEMFIVEFGIILLLKSWLPCVVVMRTWWQLKNIIQYCQQSGWLCSQSLTSKDLKSKLRWRRDARWEDHVMKLMMVQWYWKLSQLSKFCHLYCRLCWLCSYWGQKQSEIST